MTNRQLKILLNIWMIISVITLVIGAIFKIQHYENAQAIFMTGTAFWFISMGLRSYYKKKMGNS